MAAGNFTLYNSAKRKFLDGGGIDLDAATLRVKLYKAAAAASVSAANAISLFSQIGTTNASGNCSVKSLTGTTVTALNGSATQSFDSADLVYTATGGAISTQYMVMYQSVSAGGGPTVGWCKLSTSGIEVTTGNTLTINAPANGWFVAY